MTRKHFMIKSPWKNVVDWGGGRTRNLLITSRMCIQLSHRGRPLKVHIFTKTTNYNKFIFEPRQVKMCLRGMHGQRRSWSDCAVAQSDEDLHCPLKESMDTTEYMNAEQRPGWYFAHAQDDLNAHFALVRRHVFAWRGPFIARTNWLVDFNPTKDKWWFKKTLKPELFMNKTKLCDVPYFYSMFSRRQACAELTPRLII